MPPSVLTSKGHPHDLDDALQVLRASRRADRSRCLGPGVCPTTPGPGSGPGANCDRGISSNDERLLLLEASKLPAHPADRPVALRLVGLPAGRPARVHTASVFSARADRTEAWGYDHSPR